jgi:hypothetical protein
MFPSISISASPKPFLVQDDVVALKPYFANPIGSMHFRNRPTSCQSEDLLERLPALLKVRIRVGRAGFIPAGFSEFFGLNPF